MEGEPPHKEEQLWTGTRRYDFTTFPLHLV
jgi:hypothetical protein